MQGRTCTGSCFLVSHTRTHTTLISLMPINMNIWELIIRRRTFILHIQCVMVTVANVSSHPHLIYSLYEYLGDISQFSSGIGPISISSTSEFPEAISSFGDRHESTSLPI